MTGIQNITSQPRDTDNIDVLKTQRRGEIRYLPFVTTIESITEEKKNSETFQPNC